MTAKTRVGTVIEEKYRLDEQIGHGSMGAVYRGTQLMVDRSVAVKLLHPNFAGHDKIQARFEVEAKAIARLNHPNCITLFDFGYSEDMAAFYTVVEYIDGLSLEKLIDQRPCVSRIVDLVKQIASALGHAHHHGILHRDLKPENIMLAEMTDGSEMVKVLDFGIAQIMQGNADDDEETDEFESDRLTRVGEVFGTPPYMSPEQAHSAHDLTPATDLYSLGVIFYELLEGRLPFFADTPVDIMSMHINDPPPPFEHAEVPESLESVVFQMLAKDPEERPESGDKIVELLDAIPDDELSDTSGAVASAPGDVDASEPTLLSSPPDADTLTDEQSSPDQPASHDEPAPGEASELYELSDIVSEPDDRDPPPEAASAPQATSAPPRSDSAASPSPTADDTALDDSQELKSTRIVVDPDDDADDGLDDDVDSAASSIVKKQRQMIIGVVIAVVATGGALVWIIVEYELFSVADEDTTAGAAEIASQLDEQPTSQSGTSSQPDPADALDEPRDPGDEYAETDEAEDIDGQTNGDDEDNGDNDEDNGDNDEDNGDEVTEDQQDEPDASEQRQADQPAPTQRPPQPADEPDEQPPPAVAPADEPAEEDDDETDERPTRLDL